MRRCVRFINRTAASILMRPDFQLKPCAAYVFSRSLVGHAPFGSPRNDCG